MRYYIGSENVVNELMMESQLSKGVETGVCALETGTLDVKLKGHNP